MSNIVSDVVIDIMRSSDRDLYLPWDTLTTALLSVSQAIAFAVLGVYNMTTYVIRLAGCYNYFDKPVIWRSSSIIIVHIFYIAANNVWWDIYIRVFLTVALSIIVGIVIANLRRKLNRKKLIVLLKVRKQGYEIDVKGHDTINGEGDVCIKYKECEKILDVNLYKENLYIVKDSNIMILGKEKCKVISKDLIEEIHINNKDTIDHHIKYCINKKEWGLEQEAVE